MPAEELCSSSGLDREAKAKSRIRCKAGDDKEHLVVVWLQTEVIGEVKAMVIACIENKPEDVDIGLVESPFQHTCLKHLQDCVVNGD
jgi:hypothetical protein